MDCSSVVFKRFMSLPTPFTDDSPLKSLGSSPDFPVLPRSSFTSRLSSAASEDEDVLTERMKSSRITLEDISLLGDDENSRDSGFGSEIDVPVSLEGLFNKPLLFSPSAEKSDNDDSILTTPGLKKPSSKAKTLFGSGAPFASLDNTPLVPHKSRKRLSPSQDVEGCESFSLKRRRSMAVRDCANKMTPTRPSVPRLSSSESIKSALAEERDLYNATGDFSRPHCLPTITGRHKDLQAISPQTMSDVLNNQYSDQVGEVTIVDCRYPYEYNGGHIQSAVNIWERDTMYSWFQKHARLRPTTDRRHVVIFHCEFSSERAPKMSRFLRKLDREANKESYPALFYPELYLLEGGYKAFYLQRQEQCVPQTYLPMAHSDFLSDLKHFRAKSKTWAGEKSSKTRKMSFRQLKM